MKKIKHLFVSFVFFISIQIFADSVEWEAVEGAASYQFQVIDSNNKIVQENKELKVLKVELQIKKPGKYKYKIGVVDKLGNVVFGDWVEFEKEETALPKSFGPEYPIHLEWQEFKEANIYYLEVFNSQGKLFKAYKTKINQKDFKAPADKYKYRVAHEINGKKVWSEWKDTEVLVPEVAKEAPLIERKSVLWRSAVIPGWGQYYRSDAKWRVGGYAALFPSILLATGYIYQKNQSAENDFQSKTNNLIILQASNSSFATSLTLLSYNQVQSAQGEINSTHSQGSFLTLAVLGVYLFNIADSYFFYRYSKPITETDKKPVLRLQYNTPYNLAAEKRESIYGMSFNFEF